MQTLGLFLSALLRDHVTAPKSISLQWALQFQPYSVWWTGSGSSLFYSVTFESIFRTFVHCISYQPHLKPFTDIRTALEKIFNPKTEFEFQPEEGI